MKRFFPRLAAEHDEDSEHNVADSPPTTELAGRDTLAGLSPALSNRAVARFLGQDEIARSDPADAARAGCGSPGRAACRRARRFSRCGSSDIDREWSAAPTGYRSGVG